MTPTQVEPVAAAVERAAEELAARWRAGDRPLADEYLSLHPDLAAHPDAALELIAEELALRDEYGEPTTADELAARFPRWAAQVRALVECQQAARRPARPTGVPGAGERLGEFDLRAELGRGGHGRVYLATQPALGHRPVVLKVAPDAGWEHLSLARLQHTHIVPLYSAHEFPDRRLRALCLPYFAGATLAEVAARVAAVERPAGRDLLAASAGGPPKFAPASQEGPAWGFLHRATLADAVCWVGACLADALQYAHDRGLLHLDLKPSNVLLAADGVPMLLDFHLARPPLAAGEPSPGWLGGTPGFMAPEQAAAVEAVRAGRPVPAAVGARADVYALGVLLQRFAAETRCGLSRGAADILARCTAADPAARYPAAGDVAADLRRHLSDRPLKGVGNRSLRERWRKWRRRHPYALPLGSVLATLAAVALGLAAHADRLADRGRAALRDGRAHLADGRYTEAAEVLRAGEAVAAGLPFRAGLRAELRAARAAAERAVAADDLHAFAERVRWLAAAEHLPPAEAAAVGRKCREVWTSREPLVAKLTGQPVAEREERWRADLLDVAVLAAGLGVRSADLAGRPDAHRGALDTLAQAEQLLGPTAVIELERGRHLRALGQSQAAADAERRAVPPRTAWGHLVAGRSYLEAGDLTRAAAEFDAAVALDPRPVWANHYRGVVNLKLGRPTEAVAAFAACVAVAPDAAWCVGNRGLAYAAAGRPDAALADFDRALVLDPSLVDAYLGRAAVRHSQGRHAEALADLQAAADRGAPPAEVHYRRAVVQLAKGDRAGAADSLRACLAARPNHPDAAGLLKRLTGG
ncbi:MAG: tetratricopeptide repeat protein [Gemmataceae bacterium]